MVDGLNTFKTITTKDVKKLKFSNSGNILAI